MKRKAQIFIVTLLTTLTAVIYAFIAKPVYQGSALVEIGEVVNNNEVVSNDRQTNLFYLDNVNNLKDIIIQAGGVSADVPKQTSNLLELSYASNSKDEISTRMRKAVDYIMQRHLEKAKLYQNPGAKVRMTQIVGKITISDHPVRPKRVVIIAVTFITGLMLSIFLAFFLEFIEGVKRKVA